MLRRSVRECAGSAPYMEIEAKFRVDDPAVFTTLLGLERFGAYYLNPTPACEYQRNTYYDTTDRRLQQERATLRVRDLGIRRIAAFKRPRPSTGVIRERDEWEVEIGNYAHPLFWPKSEARNHALYAVGVAPLQPLFTVQTRRRTIAVFDGAGRVAEICLDAGHINAGRRVVGFRELEVELAHGRERTELEQLLDRLQQVIPLIAEPRSKKQRGLDLLSRVQSQEMGDLRTVGA